MFSAGIKILGAAIVFTLLMISWLFAKDKIKIEDVNFDGNASFSSERLSRLMLSRESGFLSKSYYYPEILEDDIANIKLFYQNNGYLDTKIVDSSVLIDSIRNSTIINITLDEGVLTRVEGLSILGNEVFEDSVLLELVNLEPGDPFKRLRVQEGMIAIASLYADHGYIDAVIRPDIKISSESHLVMIDILINENQQAYIYDVKLKGLIKTKSFVITRELSFKPRQAVSYSKLLESQKKLYLTGLFESVFIRPTLSADSVAGQKTIWVEVKEKLSSELNIAVGYGSVERARGRVELLNNNLFGTGRQAGVSLSASFIRRAAEASFSEPWTFGLKVKTDLNLQYEYLEEPGYDLQRYGAKITIGKSLNRNSSINLTYRLEEADLTNIELLQIPTITDSHIRSLLLSIVYDTRDNLFNPKRGNYIEWSNELAGSFLRGNNTFIRSILKLKKFQLLDQQTIFGSAIEIGWMDYFGTSNDISLNERFYAGGPSSIRGFGYQLVGPLENEDVPLGGKFKVVWNILEVRRSIYKMFGIAAFLDAGNVWRSIKEFNIDDSRFASGPGLRANTPIGLMRLDLGFNISPRDDEPKTKLHFSVGHSF